MDFWKTILVLLRRWYVAVPVLLLSLGSAATIYASVPVRYQSHGVIVFTSPVSGPSDSASADQGDTNPLLAFDPSLEVAASIIAQSLNTPVYLEELLGPGGEDSVEISNKGGPFIAINAESADAQRAQALVTTVLERVGAALKTRQSELHAPPSTFIVVNPVVAPTAPEPQIGGKIRAAGAALVLGLAASLGSAYTVESIREGRRRRSARHNPATSPTAFSTAMAPPDRPAPPVAVRSIRRRG